MTWLGTRTRPLVVLVAAVALLLGSIVAMAVAGIEPGPTGSMMGPGRALAGDGPVDDVEGARLAADRFADRWSLTAGEVMQFDNGFYVELVDPGGDLATEVLVDPRSGAVRLEFGPAMMWNTAYGMHAGDPGPATVTPEEAVAVATDWLRAHRPGEDAGEAEAFPGYYTLHVLDGDEIVGMLSVHAVSGAVWYHSWHGRFIAMDEPDES